METERNVLHVVIKTKNNISLKVRRIIYTRKITVMS